MENNSQKPDMFLMGLLAAAGLAIVLCAWLKPLGMGDRVHVRGMYEWNDLGGLVHWTHHDPQGFEEGGWIRYRRKVFQ